MVVGALVLPALSLVIAIINTLDWVSFYLRSRRLRTELSSQRPRELFPGIVAAVAAAVFSVLALALGIDWTLLASLSLSWQTAGILKVSAPSLAGVGANAYSSSAIELCCYHSTQRQISTTSSPSACLLSSSASSYLLHYAWCSVQSLC